MSRGIFTAVILSLSIFTQVESGIDLGVKSAMAQSGAVRSIRVEGNRRVEPETVKSYMQIAVGDRYSPGKVDDSLKSLFRTGLFADVKIRRQGSTVIVKVVENPIINVVAFEGNKEVEDATLKTEVQLKPREIYTRARVQSDVQRILDVYQRQGLYSASVQPKIIKLKHNRVDLVYEITEGHSTKVRSINFIGNRAFSDSQLRDVITTTETAWFRFLSSTNVYDPDRLNLDRELVRAFYLKNGYADMRVVSATAELDRDGKHFFMTFVVDEGEKYKFGDVTISSSLDSVKPEALKSALLTETDHTYNASQIEKSVEAVTLEVSNSGYAFARVRPKIHRDPVEKKISVHYNVEQGPRVYIERINIYGNARTKDFVIRREFRLAEGDAFNRLLVSRARKRLMGLGFFKTVNVSREAGSASDRVVLNVNVVEQSTGEFSFGAGYSTSEGVIGDVSITERNLMGNGQFLRLKLSGSIQRLQVDLSFTEPRFLDRNLAAGVDLFHKEIDNSKESSYKSKKTGGGLRLGFPLGENTRLTTSYSFVRDEISLDLENGQPASAAIVQAADDNDGVSHVSSVSYSLVYDARNHPRSPTHGLYASLSQDLAGAGGDVQYLRTQAEIRGYYDLGKRFVLVGRAQAGHIFGWGGDDVRLLDNFYKGGDLVRGFEKSGIGPRDGTTDDALGGTTFAGITAELRFPFPYLTEELGISGAVFADAGTVFGISDTSETAVGSTNVEGNGKTIRASVGGSILWDSPLGPLRGDLAYVLNEEEGDKEEVFRFGSSARF